MKKNHLFATGLTAVLLAGALGYSALHCTAKEPVDNPASPAATTGVDASKKVIRIDFASSSIQDGAPNKWTLKNKFWTPKLKFRIVEDDDAKCRVLEVISDKASGALIYSLEGIDLNRYQIMRWKWKVNRFPAGADARIKEKDDQIISLHLGFGKMTTESVSFSWETETPKGTTGDAVYSGVSTVHWTCMRNKDDKEGIWYEDSVNVRDAILKRMKRDTLPDNIGLTLSCNSQYTGTNASASLAWIEFVEK